MTNTLVYSTPEEIANATKELAENFQAGLTRPLSFRKKQLNQMIRMLDEHEAAIAEAVRQDLNKHRVEVVTTEIALIRDDAARAVAKLDRWAAPEYPSTRLTYALSKPHIRKEPFGMVLIMGAWNYPVSLALLPMVAAIAAGNTVVLKPSELAPNTARLITELVGKYLDRRAYRVLNGAVEESTQLLNTHFDYIFYTGNGTVGRIVMQAASKNLTPVTLELGGKSPVVIHKSCNIQVSAQRIFFGKFSNCGQTCIAPDYVLCPSDLIPKFVDALQNAYLSSFGGDALKSDCYGRIINHRHFDRLEGLLKESISQGAEVLIGGATKRDIKYIEPTVLKCTKDVALMRDEIFGPFLPIIPTETIDEAIDFINSRDQPLALYVFATDKAVIDKVLGSTRSGGVCINDTVINYAVPQLPFGGVGQSGMGRYRGKYGFDTFTYMRSVIHSGYLDEPLRKSVLYPPYSVKILPLIKFASSGYTRTGKRIKWTFIFSLLFFVLAYWARLRANTN